MRDAQYYEAAKSGSLASRVLIFARDRIYADFIRRCSPLATSTILDVGVSDALEDGANVLERKYPYLDKVTACGLGTAEEFQRRFAPARYVQIVANEPLPFADKQFDIATCNAVLEHVGSKKNQAQMIDEMCRVAHQVFVTVPHKYFPVEHHTGIPFMHYTAPTFRVAAAILGKSRWTIPSNLILMTKSSLRAAGGGRAVDIGFTGVRLGPLSSNLYAWIIGHEGHN